MTTTQKIGIVGNGNVGSALARGLSRARYQVRAVDHEPSLVREVAAWGDVVILAVPFAALDDVASKIGKIVEGKTVIDVTNALSRDLQLAVGHTTSGAEQLQARMPGARVVKAFNTQFAQHMDTGRLADRKLTAFVAGDDATAKKTALELAAAIGFDACDAGPLSNARLLEPLGLLNIQLGYVLGNGPQIGLALLRG